MRHLTMVAGALALWVSGASADVLPGPLVNVEWLAENREDVLVIDVRKNTESYANEGHIPGAALLDWRKARGTRAVDDVELQYMLPDRAAFEALMRDTGVSDDSAVVLAHAGDTPYQVAYAARVYWQLKYYGHDRVALLDGGTKAWEAAGHPLSTAAFKPATGDFTARAERNDILASTADVETAVKDGTHVLVDGRPLSFYLGMDQRDYVYAKGHIPGAKVVPFNINTPGKAPATFRPADQLRDAYAALGVDPGKPAIAYCNSGAVSAATWFVLSEILGNKRAKHYDGSMHEWTQDPSRPVVAMRME
jgi:thiosulfate/3-mercaptopyruvate sulfurtransferase